jgi:hypothetical protein
MIRAISKYWWVFTLRGLIAIAFGLAALLWPALTLGVMVLLFGLFALFEGGLTIVTSFGKGDEKGGSPDRRSCWVTRMRDRIIGNEYRSHVVASGSSCNACFLHRWLGHPGRSL